MNKFLAGRKNLVIVRAGSRSLHPAWLDLPYDQRSFDLIVSYYDAEAFRLHIDEKGVFAVLNPGGKWDGLYAALEWLGDDVDSYEFTWLPDDDIETRTTSINEIFDLMRKYDLSVAQPSLTRDSYYTHFLFLNCPGLKLRRTNFVEIMVPCLTVKLLKAVKPHFKASMSGFGLDYTWCRLPEAGVGRAAILDTVSVRHTRPVGNVLLSIMARSGISPKDEEARLNALYGIKQRITPLAYSAVTRSGKEINGLASMGTAMALRYAGALFSERGAVRNWNFHRLVQLFRRQVTRKIDLSILVVGADSGDPPLVQECQSRSMNA